MFINFNKFNRNGMNNPYNVEHNEWWKGKVVEKAIERQRLALVRGISKSEDIRKRKSKEVTDSLLGEIIHIDGFNTIITLEDALPNSLTIKSMDSTRELFSKFIFEYLSLELWYLR